VSDPLAPDLYSPEPPNRSLPMDRCQHCHRPLPAEYVETHRFGQARPVWRMCSDLCCAAFWEEHDLLAKRRPAV
jgi:hypothetical protein